jgi:NDP-hexose 4-ketoreductase
VTRIIVSQETQATSEQGMQIVGRGMIARSLGQYRVLHADTIAFAAGVSSSSSVDTDSCDREKRLLAATLDEARVTGRRVVYFSGGGALYGPVERPADERAECHPLSEYGRHQLRCERLVVESGVPYMIARLPNVVGTPANPAQLVPALVKAVVKGRVVVQQGALRDVIDSADMARLLSELLSAGHDRLTINVATGHAVEAGRIVDEICSILGVNARREYGGEGEDQALGVRLLHEVLGRNPFPDSSEYQEVLARHVPLLAEEARRDMARP